MKKIALITDSTCGLPAEYIDGITITANEVYSRLNEELPTTSMPSVQDICDIYETLLKEGYTHVIAMSISSGLSGTINSFRLAATEYEDKITSFVFDTKILSMAVGLSVIEIGKMIQNGKDFEYICTAIPKLREDTSMYFTVDTLEYLIKGGRIGKVTGSVGQLLNLKPIITMDEDGKYTNHSKIRGSKKAFNTLVALATNILDQCKGKVIIMTGTMHEEAKKLEEILSKHKNTTFMYSGTITPAVGIHSGPRLLAVAVLKESELTK